MGSHCEQDAAAANANMCALLEEEAAEKERELRLAAKRAKRKAKKASARAQRLQEELGAASAAAESATESADTHADQVRYRAGHFRLCSTKQPCSRVNSLASCFCL